MLISYVVGLKVLSPPEQLISHRKSRNKIHDAEYYVLETQYWEKWAGEDKVLGKNLLK